MLHWRGRPVRCSILTTVLPGDRRLANRLEGVELLPIASRIRSRLCAEPMAASPRLRRAATLTYTKISKMREYSTSRPS
jgi:hypothetical protein